MKFERIVKDVPQTTDWLVLTQKEHDDLFAILMRTCSSNNEPLPKQHGDDHIIEIGIRISPSGWSRLLQVKIDDRDWQRGERHEA